MKINSWLLGAALLGSFQIATAAGSPSVSNRSESQDQSLDEFEMLTEKMREFSQAIASGQLLLPLKIQEYDTKAVEVKPYTDPSDYRSAVTDRYYGYQVFILVDKSIASRSSKVRQGDIRTPQTMYIYEREGDALRLVSTHPVSTGREPQPNKSDTREGFMRVQSAQKTYTSRKYGEAMPYSLWFESEYGTAIHETLQNRCDSMIGMRASAGCIRLCPGEAESVFNLVTNPKYPRTSAIVLLDKRVGRPIARGTDDMISRSVDENGMYVGAPKVIRGRPVFVRIIDGNTRDKIQEIESLIHNPTEGFQQYFKPFSPQVLEQLTI